jgi:hypothetical protein
MAGIFHRQSRRTHPGAAAFSPVFALPWTSDYTSSVRNGSPYSSQRWATALTLIAANLIPLAGVLAFGWDVASLLFIYWLESAVVGFFNVLRMAQARGEGPGPTAGGRRLATPERPPGNGQALPQSPTFFAVSSQGARQLAGASKFLLIPFFLVHYGIFMSVHLGFLLSLFGPPRIPALELSLTTSVLFASHGFSYLTHYLLQGENLRATPVSEMPRPYGRIVVMHLTILLGAFLVTQSGSPAWALAVMVGVKILIDLVAHFRSHATRLKAVS